MLKRLSFDVEVLTPAFVGGHEPRKLDEYTPLRPHTVRGLLRWWFRAAAGDSRGAQVGSLDSPALAMGDKGKGKLEPTRWDEIRGEKEVAG